MALNNYQLDAAYAAAELLLHDSDLQLTGIHSPIESAPTSQAISGLDLNEDLRTLTRDADIRPDRQE